MPSKKEYNSPKNIFKEQDDLVVVPAKKPDTVAEMTSLRRSEITSIAPDDLNWDNVYSGKTSGLRSIKSEAGKKSS